MTRLYSIFGDGSPGTLPSTPNVPHPLRVAFFNIYLGLPSAGTAKHTALSSHLKRVSASIQGLSEVTADDLSSRLPAIQSMLSLPNSVSGDYSTNGLQPALITSYPILSSDIVGDGGAYSEFIRRPVYAELDVGHSTKSLGVYVIHTESLCYSSGQCGVAPLPRLEWNRAVEWMRLKVDIENRQAGNPDLEIAVIGDHNDDPEKTQTASFASQPTHPGYGFSGTYNAVMHPFDYAAYPRRQTSDAGLTLLESTNLDGNRGTLWVGDPNALLTDPWHIDYISHSSGLTAIGHEVVDSEAVQTGGLAKYGSPLAAGASQDASDHKMVFADFSM